VARWALFTGIGLVVDPLVGVAIGAADSFLLDKILKGWKPDVFVEGSLKPFVHSK
jgi:hypothetical protein